MFVNVKTDHEHRKKKLENGQQTIMKLSSITRLEERNETTWHVMQMGGASGVYADKRGFSLLDRKSVV